MYLYVQIRQGWSLGMQKLLWHCRYWMENLKINYRWLTACQVMILMGFLNNSVFVKAARWAVNLKIHSNTGKSSIELNCFVSLQSALVALYRDMWSRCSCII